VNGQWRDAYGRYPWKNALDLLPLEQDRAARMADADENGGAAEDRRVAGKAESCSRPI
jgi:hypothetical protein